MLNFLASKKSIPVSIQHRSNPFQSIQNELSRAMAEFNHWFEPYSAPAEHFEKRVLTPAVDIVDTKDGYKVEMEMPGMDENDINVSVTEGLLTVKGEKTISKNDKDNDYLTREIHYGSYERQIHLPDSVDIEQAKASFKKGMLWIDIPKKPEMATSSRTLHVEKV